MHKNSVTFGRVVSEISSRTWTDTHTRSSHAVHLHGAT